KFAASQPAESVPSPPPAVRPEAPSASTPVAPAAALTPPPVPNPPPHAGEGRVGVSAPLANGQSEEPRDGRVFASPLARRMAHHAGLDLAALRGSGPQGRIVKADVEAALAHPAAGALPGTVAAPSMAPVFAKAQMLA